MKGPSFSITDVLSTMLITLYARARESTSMNPIITDSKAVEMIEIIKKEIGVTDSRYFEKWNENFKFLDEWTYFDDHEKKLGWFNLFSSIEILRKVQWVLYYRINN